jgi:hypothetical protein
MYVVPTLKRGLQGAVMDRGLLAPLSPREISYLRHLLQRRDLEPDPVAFKRFAMLGLVEETAEGFAITELGRRRLDTEQANATSHPNG